MQIDQEALGSAVKAFCSHNGGLDDSMEEAITAYLTALASQEGAQAGEVERLWNVVDAAEVVCSFYWGENDQDAVASIATLQKSLAALGTETTPPVSDDAVRAAVEAERRVILGLIAIICGEFSDCSASFVCDRIDEAIRARKGGAA